MISHTDLMEALRDCYIPALRRDVVAAGLVHSASLAVDSQAPGAGIPGVPVRYVAHITLHAPGSDKALNAQAQAAVENRLLGLPWVSQVSLSMQPALFPILNGR